LYEFIENGSLHDILNEKNPPPPLTWNVRFNIAVRIAEGLAYLHNCDSSIVHRDIKPKHILIDDNMEPIIADFGTALYRNCMKIYVVIQKLGKCVGTPGYIEPSKQFFINTYYLFRHLVDS
jgi:serine/threonine protein kinase